MVKKFLLICLCVIPAAVLPAQEIADGSADSTVMRRTTLEYFLDEGLTEPVIEEIINYDADGRILEEKEFNKTGEIRKWELFTYDSAGNVIQFRELDEKGNLKERVTYVYRSGLLVEKRYYDHKNRLYKKKRYEYTCR